jgi:4-hydroxy-3-polyprenylbenzoate decarboxylase
MGLDATNKWIGESSRRWGDPITHDAAIRERMDALYERLAGGAS